MNLVDTQDRKKFDEQIQKAIKEALPKKDAHSVILFAEQLFTSLFLDEFKGRRVTDILGLVISAWKFVSNFDGKHAKVEVFNPNLEVSGWQSSHTVLMVLQKSVPFIVDSVRMELSAREVKTHSIQYSTIRCERDKKGEATSFLSKNETLEKSEETLVFIEVDKHSDKKALNSLHQSIESVMEDVTITVDDYLQMLAHTNESAEQLTTTKSKAILKHDLKEGVDFLNWIKNDRFTYLGYVEYKLTNVGKKQQLEPVKGTELGILRKHSEQLAGINLNCMPDEKKQALLTTQLITFAKSSHRSSVHRPSYPDYISIKKFDEKGKVVGEHCFLGLYTAQAYHESPDKIPLIRQKTIGTLFQLHHHEPNHASYERSEPHQHCHFHPN